MFTCTCSTLPTPRWTTTATTTTVLPYRHPGGRRAALLLLLLLLLLYPTRWMTRCSCASPQHQHAASAPHSARPHCARRRSPLLPRYSTVAKVRYVAIQPATLSVYPSTHLPTRPPNHPSNQLTHDPSAHRATFLYFYPPLTVGSLKVWARAVAEAPLHCLRLSAHAALARARRSE